MTDGYKIKRGLIRVNNPEYKNLPSAYQQVEYIGTTGTQYIDTGIFPGTNIQVETKITVQSTAQEKTVFGNYKSSTTGSYLYYHLTAYSNAWYYGINGSEGHAGSYSPVIGTQYEIVYNNENNQLSVNGTEVGSTSGTQGQPGSTLYISARGTTNSCYGYFNYYTFKVFNKTTGEYERDFVPCYRKQDSVIGMYDLITDTFYTNNGTGTFTKGNDVVSMMEKQFYPSGINPYYLLTDVIVYYPMLGNLNDDGPNGWNISTDSGSYTGTDYLTFSNFKGRNASGTYSTSSSITCSTWCNGATGQLFVLGSDSYSGWGAVLGSDGMAIVVSGTMYGAGTSAQSGWFMSTGVFDYTNHVLKAYVNGELVGTTNVGNGGLRGGVYIGMGANSNYSSNTQINGSMGITFATQNAMTQEQIQEFYNASKSLYGL